MTVPEPNVIRGELDGARVCLAAAKQSLAAKLVAPAVSSTYYAIFHAARAVLWTHGHSAKTHQGLAMLFDQEMVKTGAVEQKYMEILRYGRDQRQLADYDLAEFDFSVNDAQDLWNDAAQFVERMEKLAGQAPASAGK
jgi:uncharacterized protein (UPF0332 family)